MGRSGLERSGIWRRGMRRSRLGEVGGGEGSGSCQGGGGGGGGICFSEGGCRMGGLN